MERPFQEYGTENAVVRVRSSGLAWKGWPVSLFSEKLWEPVSKIIERFANIVSTSEIKFREDSKMASYTREQINRWNAKLQNGFELDIKSLLNHNEKEATKYLDLPGDKRLKATLTWCEVRDGYRYTGQVQPKLHLSIWHSSHSGMMVSYGMGAFVDITEQTYARRNWNEIVKLTAAWTDDKIMETAQQHIAALKKETVG